MPNGPPGQGFAPSDCRVGRHSVSWRVPGSRGHKSTEWQPAQLVLFPHGHASRKFRHLAGPRTTRARAGGTVSWGVAPLGSYPRVSSGATGLAAWSPNTALFRGTTRGPLLRGHGLKIPRFIALVLFALQVLFALFALIYALRPALRHHLGPGPRSRAQKYETHMNII